ncbi:MAG: GGDEF domain-containing protein [Lactimicrobium sp.]|jgi:diguanylate cyclase (GGDEF)-like protein|uniref:GGDEF domain-containing protein n=1 Tax=Lactimicrobium sp. TaxID=2563780 RepID=UPI002F353D6A
MQYKVAFLTFDWNYMMMTGLLKGIRTRLGVEKDVTFYVFNALARYLDEEIEEGSLEIFNLCRLSDYDGILIQGNVSWPVEQRQHIVNAAHALGIPVISVNYPLDNAVYVGTDNYTAMADMTEHVISVHHARKIYYASGRVDSQESIQRERGFLDTCHKAGIAGDDCRVVSHGWNEENGAAAAKYCLEHEMPDALVCANDTAARGALKYFEKHGIQVPQDLIVTGFDGQPAGYEKKPEVTTMVRDFERIGAMAASTIISMMKGEKTPSCVYVPAHLHVKDTCGCERPKEDTAALINAYGCLLSEVHRFLRVQSHDLPGMGAASNLIDLEKELEKDVSHAGLDHFALLLDQNYLENYENPDGCRHYSHTLCLGAWSPAEDHSLIPDPVEHIYARIDSDQILPKELLQLSNFYLIMPLRLNHLSIGIVVLPEIPDIMENGFLAMYLSMIENALENVRRKTVMTKRNQQLDDLYIHDSLTGFFNRFGLEKYGNVHYEKTLSDCGKVYVAFIDIDRMKQINDRYGHRAGDEAICTASRIIRMAVDQKAFLMRYGGDEFVAICQAPVKDAIEAVCASVLSKEKTHLKGLSVGEICVQQQMPLDQAIARADDCMYREKHSHDGLLVNAGR